MSEVGNWATQSGVPGTGWMLDAVQSPFPRTCTPTAGDHLICQKGTQVLGSKNNFSNMTQGGRGQNDTHREKP